MQKALAINADKCTGCRQCEIACSSAHGANFNPAHSRIRIFNFHDEGRFVPYTCTQCHEAWCMAACPVDAISLDGETGAKVVSEALCVGCKVCTISCPFGTINYSVSTGKVIKCDLCGGDPACARACPTEAIRFTDVEATGFEKAKAWAAKTDTPQRADV